MEEKKEAKENGEKKKKEEKKREKELLIFFAVLFLVLVGSFFGIKTYMEKISSFDWQGITFKKIKEDGMLFYKGEVFFATPEQIVKFSLYLYNHPKQLEKIFFNITEIKFRKKTYVSFSPEVDRCYGSGLAGYKLGEFLYALGTTAIGATTSEDFATERKPLITCANMTQGTIILLNAANATAIYQEKECYIIDVANCETTKAAEAFILNMIKNMTKK